MLSRIRWTSDHIQLMCTMIQRDVEILVHRQSSPCFDADASLVPQQQEPGWHWWHSLRFVASYNTNRCRVLEVKIVSVSPVLAFCPSLSGKVQAGHCKPPWLCLPRFMRVASMTATRNVKVVNTKRSAVPLLSLLRGPAPSGARGGKV